jgi:histidinol dehydrogenase
VCRKLGIENVFRVNGPAGIAALGFGTESIPRVRKIVGPGSPAVTLAQVEMQRHGVVTMMLLGPTESIVIADDAADPVRLAADLLIEAEHGTDSAVVLITTSERVADETDVELSRQLEALPHTRREAACASLGVNGGCVLVDDLRVAAEVANRYAPEHLQLAVGEPALQSTLALLTDAGEILLGQDTPFSAANFVIGCPASLPTSGFAHVSSGITAEAFLKRTAVAQADGAALRRMGPSVVALADHEGFPAHAASIRTRFS